MAYLSSISMSKDIAVNLGTSNTQAVVSRRGIAFDQPTVVTIDREGCSDKNDGRVYALGHSAKSMLGRTPRDMFAIRPIKKGVIADPYALVFFLNALIEYVFSKSFFRKNRMIVTMPFGTTEVEKIAFKAMIKKVNTAEIFLIEEPIAATIGLGIGLFESSGHMIINAGGGTTEVTIMSLGKIIYHRSMRIGGDDLDDAVFSYIRENYGLLIGEKTAEDIKLKLVTIVPGENLGSMEVKGYNPSKGIPGKIQISSLEVQKVTHSSIQLIIDAIRMSVEMIPKELIADVINNGIFLAGGCSLLRGLKDRLETEIGIPFSFIGILPCAAWGGCFVLKDTEKYEKILIQ